MHLPNRSPNLLQLHPPYRLIRYLAGSRPARRGEKTQRDPRNLRPKRGGKITSYPTHGSVDRPLARPRQVPIFLSLGEQIPRPMPSGLPVHSTCHRQSGVQWTDRLGIARMNRSLVLLARILDGLAAHKQGEQTTGYYQTRTLVHLFLPSTSRTFRDWGGRQRAGYRWAKPMQ